MTSKNPFEGAFREANDAAVFVSQFGIRQTCEMCPVQYEGKAHDGSVFYFRSRWDTTRMTVAGNIDDAVDGHGWTATLEGDDEFGSGWLPHEQAVWMMALWLEAYRISVDKDPNV